MDKALIKETGEILDVESKYTVKHMSFTFEFDLGDKLKDELEAKFVHTSNQQEEGEHYTLSDGKTYHEKEVVVGTKLIRDERIKDILE